jgi:SAM-dependent methyltransferase
MQISTLEASGLGISPDELWASFAPFVRPAGVGLDAFWRRELPRRRLALLCKVARGLLHRRRVRDLDAIRREYDRAWARLDVQSYLPAQSTDEGVPWQWRARRVVAPAVGGARFRLLLIARAIEQLQPASVLEVGCGNGINLLTLAGCLPDVSLAGLELTDAGHRAALAFQAQPTLPQAIRDHAPAPVRDPDGFRRVSFSQGSAAELPFADGAFDLVVTVLAVEQMERIRARALAELARVARRHVLMIEPFRDVNRNLWSRLNVYRRDYFRGSIDELRRYGLKPILALADFPQEAFLKACMVLAQKDA